LANPDFQTFDVSQTNEAIAMLARSFVTSPLHIAAFGADALHSNAAFFRIGLRLMKGPKFAAMDGSRIVGLIHWVEAPQCRISGLEKSRTVPEMFVRFGISRTRRLISWLSIWGQHDPAEPHSHLGPIAVDSRLQGKGIGTQMMKKYCDELDRNRRVGYLETDKPENVTFYRLLGFETLSTQPILGITNYFMLRKSA
jgi:GNAT superfamily N-acetyltransferase